MAQEKITTEMMMPVGAMLQGTRYWYQKAVKQGHEEARQRLKALGY